MWRARRPLTWAGYLCFAVVLFLLFTYLQFPSQQVRGFVLTLLRHHGLGQVGVESVQPLLPAGLTLKGVSLTHDVGGQPLELVRLPELRVQLRTFSPFANPLRLGFTTEAYGGQLMGAVAWEHNGKGPVLGVQVDLRDVRPAAHPLTIKLGDAVVAGNLAGTIDVRLSSGRWQDSSGRLTLHGDPGQIGALRIGGVQLPALTYDQLSVELTLQQGQVMVQDIQVRARDWRASVQGSVSLSERLRQSPVNLTLRVHMSETLEQQLGLIGMLLRQRRDGLGYSSLTIHGTLDHLAPVL